MKICIIGGGPAGYNGAIRAKELGLEVCLIEKDTLGGTCLNRGCIPTKCLIKSGELYQEISNALEFGITVGDALLDITAVYNRKQEVVAKLVGGIEYLMKTNRIEVIKGNATFIDRNSIKVATVSGEQIVSTDYFLIATGSSPVRLPIPGIEHTLNSDDVLRSPIDAEEITIIGGGVIGMEFASFFSSIGKKVTVIEAEKRILPLLDKDFSTHLSMLLKKRGVTIITAQKAQSIEALEGKKVVTLQDESGKQTQVISDKVIVSIGRQANYIGLGLEQIGVSYNRRIAVNEKFQTNVENIYAVGDVCSVIQLAHLAEAEAVTAVENITNAPNSIKLDTIPSCVYTSPEIASVGITSYEKGEPYRSAKAPLMANGKAVIEGVTTGFVKLVVNEENVIVGGAIMCSRATDMIAELALAVANKLKLSDLISVIHPHPTLSEAVKAAALSLK